MENSLYLSLSRTLRERESEASRSVKAAYDFKPGVIELFTSAVA